MRETARAAAWVLVAATALVGCAKKEVESCSKVDILFVVDNSGSMGDNQANLVVNFPKFASNIASTLGAGVDYHVGVVTSDAYSANAEGCKGLGALVTQTGGPASSEKVCGPFKRGRFLSREDDVAEGFKCIAQVGAGGSANEDLVGAAEAALSGMGMAACNGGFLRSDSLLVLVFITDEDTPLLTDRLKGVFGADYVSGTQERLRQASGRSPNKTVFVSLATGVPGNACRADETGSKAEQLIALTQRYKYHHLGDICAADYGDVLVKALSPVQTACANLELEELEETSCRNVGPGTKDWLFSLLAALGGAVVMSVVSLATVSRGLAGKGFRQSSANLAGLGLGVFLGAIPGMVVPVVRDCYVASGPGYVAMALSALGFLVFVMALIAPKGK